MKTNSFENPTVVSSEKGLAARRELLREEKKFTKLRERLAARLRVEEAPGLSVFAHTAGGEVNHTYSTYARGLELIGTYTLLDLVPKGRDEDPEATMSWVRHHDNYGQPADVIATS